MFDDDRVGFLFPFLLIVCRCQSFLLKKKNLSLFVCSFLNNIIYIFHNLPPIETREIYDTVSISLIIFLSTSVTVIRILTYSTDETCPNKIIVIHFFITTKRKSVNHLILHSIYILEKNGIKPWHTRVQGVTI